MPGKVITIAIVLFSKKMPIYFQSRLIFWDLPRYSVAPYILGRREYYSTFVRVFFLRILHHILTCLLSPNTTSYSYLSSFSEYYFTFLCVFFLRILLHILMCLLFPNISSHSYVSSFSKYYFTFLRVFFLRILLHILT